MRFRFYNDELFPLHIVGKCNQPRWPGEDLEDSLDWAWNCFSMAIDELHADYRVITNAFVLMSNHYHWICSYDYEKDPTVFDWFHELVQVNYLHTGHTGSKLFENDAQVQVCSNFKYYQHVYRYVYRNPLEVGLCKKAEDYPYSTLTSVLGEKDLSFVCIDNMNIMTDPFRTLDWINGQQESELWLRN